MISAPTGLYVFLCYPTGKFLWVAAHLEAEEWKSGIVSHQYSQGGVKIGLVPLARHGPASQLHAEKDRLTQT